VCSVHRASMNIHELLACYNVSREYLDDEDSRNVEVLEMEGEHAIEAMMILRMVMYIKM
jgi:hypothetical protein